MDTSALKFFAGVTFALAILSFGNSEPAFGQNMCKSVNGVADLKEGGQSKGRAQYWINGFPGRKPMCSYTMQLCFVGERKEIGSKIFMTSSDGRKHQSSDNILNCQNGWSSFFNGRVAGAKQILVAVPSGYDLNVRFVGKSPLRSR